MVEGDALRSELMGMEQAQSRVLSAIVGKEHWLGRKIDTPEAMLQMVVSTDVIVK